MAEPTGMPSGDDAESHWLVREEPNAVTVRNARVVLGPELTFTRDEWSELLRVVAGGGLPSYAHELRDGYVVKIAPPGREADALFFWRDEMDAFVRDVRGGRYGPVSASG
jgi:hypothetical protein